MKTYIILFFLTIPFFCYSQTLTVEYEKKLNAKKVALSKTEMFRMIFSKNKSIFYGISNDSMKYENKKFIESIKKIGNVRLVKMDDNTYDYSFNEMLYKDYSKDTLFLNDLIMNRMVSIGEKLNKLKWTVNGNIKKVILGKDCISATTNFRGRSYTAFFSTDFEGIVAGPWKFDGLPGVILSVKSDDGYVAFRALKLFAENKEAIINNPFEKTKNISWKEFKKQYKRTMLNLLKQMKSLSDPGDSGSIEATGTGTIENLGIKKLEF
ncbi:MAG: GLPGLI family protein [Polaribacter sp.]